MYAVTRSASWLLLLALLSGLSACQPQPQEVALPFETIEQKEWAGTGQAYEPREPGLMIIAQIEDVAKLDNWITENARTQLQTLDYDAYFALAVFQGWKPSTGYNVQIESATRQDNTVTIHAGFREPGPDEAKGALITSPYHLVRVRRIGDWNQNIAFKLVVDSVVVTSLSHHVP
jgi:hypothetical protein